MERAIFVAVGAAIGGLAVSLVIFFGNRLRRTLTDQGLASRSPAVERGRRHVAVALVIVGVAFGAALGAIFSS